MTTEQKIAVDDALRTISAELVPNISVMERSIYNTWKHDVDDMGVNWGNDYERIFDPLRGVVDEHLLLNSTKNGAATAQSPQIKISI